MKNLKKKKMKTLCENCKMEFDQPEAELEYDELDPSGRSWNEHEQIICPECIQDREE